MAVAAETKIAVEFSPSPQEGTHDFVVIPAPRSPLMILAYCEEAQGCNHQSFWHIAERHEDTACLHVMCYIIAGHHVQAHLIAIAYDFARAAGGHPLQLCRLSACVGHSKTHSVVLTSSPRTCPQPKQRFAPSARTSFKCLARHLIASSCWPSKKCSLAISRKT